MLIEEEAYSKATELLTSAFEYHQLATPHISDESTDSPELFNLGDLETLADLLIIQKFCSKAITCIKSGVRWLQQREMETMWESMLDDREFDLSRRTREGWEKDNKAAEGAAINELDPRLRVRLGTARMGEGRIDEAKVSCFVWFILFLPICLLVLSIISHGTVSFRCYFTRRRR